jgi:heme-degrading monooxygenase HmoA
VITFGLNYDVKPEHAEQFLRVSEQVLRLLPTLRGHEETRLYADVHAPHSYLIYSKWRGVDDFRAFLASDAFRDVQTMGRDMLRGPPRHQVYETRKLG